MKLHTLQSLVVILFFCNSSGMHGAEAGVELPQSFLKAVETVKKNQPEDNIDGGIGALRLSASKLKKDDAIKLYLAAAAEVTRALYKPQYEGKFPRYSDRVPAELGLPFGAWVDPAEVQDADKREKYKKALKENNDAKKIIAIQAHAYSYFGSIGNCIALELRADTWETKNVVLEECIRLKLPERFRKELERVFQYKLPVQPPESGKSASEGSKKEPEKSPPQKTGE